MGSHTVQATVEDVTTWVRSDPSKLLTDTKKWQLTVTAGTPPRLTTLSVAPASIGAGSHISASIVGPRCVVGPHCHLEHGVVLGEGVRIGAGNVLTAGARLFPGVELPDGAIRF